MTKLHKRKLFFFLCILPLPTFAGGPWLSQTKNTNAYFNALLSASSDSNPALTLHGSGTTSTDLLNGYDQPGGQQVFRVEENGRTTVTSLHVWGNVQGTKEDPIPSTTGTAYGQRQRGLVVLQPNTEQLGHSTAFRYEYADGRDLYGMSMAVQGINGDVAYSFANFYDGNCYKAQNNYAYILRTDNISGLFRITGGQIGASGLAPSYLPDPNFNPSGCMQLQDYLTVSGKLGSITEGLGIQAPYPLINLNGPTRAKNMFITGVTDTAVGLTVKGNSTTQSADLLQLYNYNGGNMVFGVGASGAVAAGSVSTSGTLSSTKPCATGYTRIGPNYCQRNSLDAGTVLYLNSGCAQYPALSGVTDAKAVELLITNTIAGRNSAGAYNTAQLDFYSQSNSTCNGMPNNTAQDTEREWVATVDTIATHTHQIKIDSNAKGRFRYVTNGSGNITKFLVQIIGYYD